MAQPYEDPDASVTSRMESLRPRIIEYARKYGVSPSVVAAFVVQESGGLLSAYNADGGSGLLQLTPPWHTFDKQRMLSDVDYALDLGVAFIGSCLANNGGDLYGAAGQYGPHNADGDPHAPYQRSVVALERQYAGWTEARRIVTGPNVLAEALRWVGATRREQFDATNGEGGVFGFCEAFVESCHERLGLVRVRYATALAFLNDAAIPTHPLPAPAGSCVLFGRATDPAGHVAISDGSGGMIGTTANGVAHTPIWAGSVGWQWYPGVAADAGVPSESRVADARATIAGNPYGAVLLHPPFGERWRRLDALGLAFLTLGYAVEPPVTLATGRVMQRFERAVLATSGGDAPWDVVSLLLDEVPPANTTGGTPAPAPARRVPA